MDFFKKDKHGLIIVAWDCADGGSILMRERRYDRIYFLMKVAVKGMIENVI